MSKLKVYVIGSSLFLVSLFIGMLLGSLVYFSLLGDDAKTNISSSTFFGWTLAFLSMYIYTKRDWTKYISIGAFILYVTPFVIR